MTPGRSMPADSSGRAAAVAAWLLLAAVLVHLGFVFHPRGADLLDGHSFRQLQTALTADYLVRNGWRLDYETPVLGPPWSIPMEFPTYAGTVALMVRTTGVELATAGRIVALAYFYLALAALWLLARDLGVGRPARRIGLALTLTSPIYLFYGRHFLIETAALAAGLWFLWCFHRALHRSWAWAAPAAALGALAAVSKVTTFLPYGLLALALGIAALGREKFLSRSWWQLALRCAVPALPIVAATWAWINFTDGLKAQNPIGSFLVSGTLNEFNFGSLSQRMSGEFWGRILDHLRNSVSSEATLALALAALLLGRPRAWPVLAGALAATAAAVLVFANLYFIHDYYFLAVGMLVSAALGLAFAALLENPAWPLRATATLVAVAVIWQGITAWRSYGIHFSRERPAPPALAAVLAATLGEDDVFVSFGNDWHAALPFYSGRRAIMFPFNHEDRHDTLARSVALLGERRVGALVVAGRFRDEPLFVLPRARSLGLQLQPTAETADMRLYLRPDLAAAAAERLHGRTLPGVQLHWETESGPAENSAVFEDDLTREAWRGRLTMAVPAPVRLRSAFALNTPELDGQPVLAVHAPTDLVFEPPAGSRRLDAVVGLFPAAYTGTEGRTDGIVVEVWEEGLDGTNRRHYERALRPAETAADRGDQVVSLALDRPWTGRVVLRITPGPENQINYDWAYWREVRFR